MSDIYLRDFNEEIQREHINAFTKADRMDLLEAFEAGDDIIVGEFKATKDCKVA